MSKLDDGGGAFPLHAGCYSKGMSLRDYFAGSALSVLLANDEFLASIPPAIISASESDDIEVPGQDDCAQIACEVCAMRAYQIADAMLAARQAGAA
jgi:hypothetical protein